MSSSGGMSQLLKGIMIGIVLILAIVGTMSLLDKSKSSDNPITKTTTDIQAPSISINPQNSNSTNNSDIQPSEENTNTDIAPQGNENITTNTEEKPILEGETEPEKPAKIQYGELTVSSINPENRAKLNSEFAIFNKENVKIAVTSNANTASYKLPAGEYRITATLTQAPNQSGRPIPVVQKTQQLVITANSKTDQIFELEPPPTIGILQVSAVSTKADNKAVRSNYIVQKENGETVASRNNVTNSLFKLNAGSYKVTVRSGSISDFRTIIVEAGESTKEVFKLQDAAAQGRVLIRVFDTRSSNPVSADISITDAQGNLVQNLKSVTRTEISLSQGNYKIGVVGPNGKSNKNIRVIAGKPLSEIFRFDAPQTPANDSDTNNGTQITENVTIKAVEPSTDEASNQDTDQLTTQPQDQPQVEEAPAQKSSISILARNAADNRPIKSNIYIQTPEGKHLDKKVYVDSANFELPPGVYKITVRSKNRKNTVKTIRISANQQLNETFLMDNLATTTPAKPKALAPQKPAKPANQGVIPSGFLNVLMQAGNGQNTSSQNLKSHFIVTTKAGRKIVELTSVSSGNFKLDTGEYIVTAVHKNKRRNQRVTIRENRNTRLVFNSNDFAVRKGLLRSRIIDEAGRPLKGNLTVTDMKGRVVARANGVAVGEFELSPRRHSINVSYRGLSGSEVVRITSGETTIQTFTIASNSPAPANRNSKKNDTKELKRILKDKLKEQIQKQF